MDIVSLLTQYGGNGVFFVLFLWLFNKVQKQSDSNQEKAEARETKLQEQLDKSNTHLDSAIAALQIVQTISEDVKQIKETFTKSSDQNVK